MDRWRVGLSSTTGSPSEEVSRNGPEVELPGPPESSVSALEHTRSLLRDVAQVTSSAESLLEAAVGVMDALCDDTWPVASLLLRDGDYLVDADVFNTEARTSHPEVVATIRSTLQESPLEVDATIVWSNGRLESSWVSTASGADDGPADPHTREGRARILWRAGVATRISASIEAGGEVVAVLTFYSTHAYEVAPDETKTLHLVCSLLGAVAERERANAELLKRDEMWSGIERAMPDSLLVVDPVTDEVLAYTLSSAIGGRRDNVVAKTGTEVFESSYIDFQGVPIRELFRRLAAGEVLTFPVKAERRADPDELFELLLTEGTVGGRNLYFIFARDVTARNRAQREFLDASSRAQSLLDVTDVGIFELDEGHHVVSANRAGAALLGLDSDNLLGKQLPDLVPFLAEKISEGFPCPPAGHVPVRHTVGELPNRVPPVVVSAALACRNVQCGEHRQIVTLSDVTAAHAGARLAAQHTQALDINDGVVQGLTVALYGLELGDIAMAVNALETTLQDAKLTVSTLLTEEGITPEVLRAIANGTPLPGSPRWPHPRRQPTWSSDPERGDDTHVR